MLHVYVVVLQQMEWREGEEGVTGGLVNVLNYNMHLAPFIFTHILCDSGPK